MTAILSQMHDRHYARYIETFTGSRDLVVSTNACRCSVLHEDVVMLKSILCSFTAGLPDGVLPALQGPDWETRVSL